jgi:hypothetical protein
MSYELSVMPSPVARQSETKSTQERCENAQASKSYQEAERHLIFTLELEHFRIHRTFHLPMWYRCRNANI